MKIAQAAYARTDAGPSMAATTAGSTKIPEPTVWLTMLAVSDRPPTDGTHQCKPGASEAGA